MTEYVFDNAAQQQASQRFGGLEATFDATTRAHLAARGIAEGWECWEIGAGGGSIARWMAEAVGPAGHVLGTDLDPSLAALSGVSNITVERHDVTADPIPSGRYDLIHARLVLIHLPDRDRVARDLVAALRPGGWLVLEEFFAGFEAVMLDGDDPDSALYVHIRSALSAFLRLNGADDRYARELPGRLERSGLQDVGADGRLVFASGRSPAAAVVRANLEQVGAGMTARGLADAEQIERAIELLDDPGFRFTLPLMISAWGRRPR